MYARVIGDVDRTSFSANTLAGCHDVLVQSGVHHETGSGHIFQGKGVDGSSGPEGVWRDASRGRLEGVPVGSNGVALS